MALLYLILLVSFASASQKHCWAQGKCPGISDFNLTYAYHPNSCLYSCQQTPGCDAFSHHNWDRDCYMYREGNCQEFEGDRNFVSGHSDCEKGWCFNQALSQYGMNCILSINLFSGKTIQYRVALIIMNCGTNWSRCQNLNREVLLSHVSSLVHYHSLYKIRTIYTHDSDLNSAIQHFQKSGTSWLSEVPIRDPRGQRNYIHQPRTTFIWVRKLLKSIKQRCEWTFFNCPKAWAYFGVLLWDDET